MGAGRVAGDPAARPPRCPPAVLLAGYDLADVVDLQRQRFAYHRDYEGRFAGESRWWQWPLALRPVWYGATNHADGTIASTYANGNPLLHWAFLAALVWVGWRWWRSRRTALLLLAVGFLGQWLPWMLVDRATFAYHFLPAVPFACLAVATAVVALADGGGWRRTLAVEFVVLVGLAFVFFYPIAAFVGISPQALDWRLWLPTWR